MVSNHDAMSDNHYDNDDGDAHADAGDSGGGGVKITTTSFQVMVF